MGGHGHEHGHDCGHSHGHAHVDEHDHGHGHGHGHEGHGHDHGRGSALEARAGGRKRLLIALVVTTAFMIAEAVGGVLSNSRALVADAGHMLTDALALGLSLGAVWLAMRPATRRKSYGWLRLEILAALVNGASLVLIGGLILWEAGERFLHPEPVDVPLMLVIAALGLGANIVSAFVLHAHAHGGACSGPGGGNPLPTHPAEGSHAHGAEGQLNVRAAYLHVLSDLAGSVGAIIAGLVMWRTQAWIVDPIVAALVGLLVLHSAWSVTKQAVDILLEGVPHHIDLDDLCAALSSAPGVKSVHDVHVWTISSGVHLMTCHAVVGDHGDHHDVLERLSCLVRDRFGIHHSTIQLECVDLSATETGVEFCERAR